MVTPILQRLGSLSHSTWLSQQTAWLQGLITQLLKNAVLTASSSRRQGTVMAFCDSLGSLDGYSAVKGRSHAAIPALPRC